MSATAYSSFVDWLGQFLAEATPRGDLARWFPAQPNTWPDWHGGFAIIRTDMRGLRATPELLAAFEAAYTVYLAWCRAQNRQEPLDQLLERTARARQAIMDQFRAECRRTGAIVCPVCNAGTLRYAIGHNGHIRAGCMTSGCVNWIE